MVGACEPTTRLRAIAHGPASSCRPAAPVARSTSVRNRVAPRISAVQLSRLNEHKDFDHNQAARDFGHTLTDLLTYLEAEVAGYRRG